MEELIVNGGAEDGLNGWEVFEGTDGSVTVGSSPSPPEGSNLFDFRHNLGIGAPQNKEITQYVETVPGTAYEGVASYNGEDGDPGAGNTLRARLLLDLEGLGFNTTVHQIKWNVEPSWHSVPFSFVALSARTGIRISVQAFVPFPVLHATHYYVDALSVPFVLAAPILGLRPVTFGDLLDLVQFDAGDFSSAYRNTARNWLNVVRSYIANQGFWRTALRGNGEINISGAETDGIYALKDASAPTPQVWAFVEGNQLWDITDNRVLTYEDPATVGSIDPDQNYAGTPNYWTDKGYNDAGEPLVMFYPRPSVATTVRGSLYKQFVAIDENQDGATIDPFFGPIDDWAHVFSEGLRYHKEQDENEVGMQSQWQRFIFWVDQRKRKQGIPSVTSHRLRNLRRDKSRMLPAVALLDPQHHDNPEI